MNDRTRRQKINSADTQEVAGNEQELAALRAIKIFPFVREPLTLERLAELRAVMASAELFPFPAAQPDERAAFEAWARISDMPLGMYSATDYADGATQISWDAWQARAASQATVKDDEYGEGWHDGVRSEQAAQKARASEAGEAATNDENHSQAYCDGRNAYGDGLFASNHYPTTDMSDEEKIDFAQGWQDASDDRHDSYLDAIAAAPAWQAVTLTDTQIEQFATDARQHEAMEFMGSSKVASHDNVVWALRRARDAMQAVTLTDAARPEGDETTGGAPIERETSKGSMVRIARYIERLQKIQSDFGNTCVYVRDASWGAVALNRVDADEKEDMARNAALQSQKSDSSADGEVS